ncbi:hypothetical protein CN221_18465, partial [Sinorhizobium meliloti]
YAPRFLPTLGHPHAVALHFTRCDQLVAGLPPAGMRPCRAHNEEGATLDERGPFEGSNRVAVAQFATTFPSLISGRA